MQVNQNSMKNTIFIKHSHKMSKKKASKIITIFYTKSYLQNKNAKHCWEGNNFFSFVLMLTENVIIPSIEIEMEFEHNSWFLYKHNALFCMKQFLAVC